MCSIIIISFRKVHTSAFNYSRKKQRGRLRIWNFQGYWRNRKWIFLGLIKNNVEFPGVLVLGLKISEGCNIILWSFWEWSLVLSRISLGKVNNLKIPAGFSKKYVVNLPVCFFWNSPLGYCLTREEHPCMGVKAPLFLLHSQYICCKYVIEDRENPQPYSVL